MTMQTCVLLAYWPEDVPLPCIRHLPMVSRFRSKFRFWKASVRYDQGSWGTHLFASGWHGTNGSSLLWAPERPGAPHLYKPLGRHIKQPLFHMVFCIFLYYVFLFSCCGTFLALHWFFDEVLDIVNFVLKVVNSNFKKMLTLRKTD